MRYQRVITLPTALSLPSQDENGKLFEKTTVDEKAHYTCIEQRWREDNTLFCRTEITGTMTTPCGPVKYRNTKSWSRDAVVDYRSILSACAVETDEDAAPPWAAHEAYGHTVISEAEFANAFYVRCDPHNEVEYDSDYFTGQRGYFCYCGRPRVVVIDDQLNGDATAIYAYARKAGAAKQVAVELVARYKQQAVNQLVKWHTEGWQYYGVTCKFDTGTDCYDESLWGIDDEEYATREITHEIAAKVTTAMEQDGYLIINAPSPQPRNTAYARTEFKRRLNQFNWEDAEI